MALNNGISHAGKLLGDSLVAAVPVAQLTPGMALSAADLFVI